MESGRYENILYSRNHVVDLDNKRRVYNTLLDPYIPQSVNDIYVITTFGDRLDTLAFHYYDNEQYWWMIAASNPQLRKDSIYLEPGIQLRIPADANSILKLYQTENSLE